MKSHDAWEYARKMHVPQHAIDQYLLRSWEKGIPGYAIDHMVRAEFVFAALGDGLKHIIEDEEGCPYARVGAFWLREPLVTLIKPLSAEGVPLVLTLLTRKMWQQSMETGRFKKAAGT